MPIQQILSIHRTTWMNLINMVSSRRQTKMYVLYEFIHIKFKNRQNYSVCYAELPLRWLCNWKRVWRGFWGLVIFYFLICMHCAKSLQSCLTLCDLLDCSPPGSSVCGVLQARILEWVAMPSSRGSSWPRDQNCISIKECILLGFVYFFFNIYIFFTYIYYTSNKSLLKCYMI